MQTLQRLTLHLGLVAAAVLSILARPLAAADEAPVMLAVGTSLTAPPITDQHDKPHLIDDSVRLILFSADMGANDLVKEALATQGTQQLAAAGAVYVAEISRMPRMITALFALPAMRRRDYDMLLDRDGTLTSAWPRHDKEVTLIELDHLRVTKIDYVNSVAGLRERLGPTPAVPPAP